MYFVNPEQSKPCGVLPPHTYGTPTYSDAVRSRLSASADGGGDSGRRRSGSPRSGRDVRPPLEVLVVVVVVAAGRLAMTVARIVSGVTPSVADAQPERRGSREATAIAPTWERGSVIMPRAIASSEPILF